MKRVLTGLLAALLCMALLSTGVLAEAAELDLSELMDLEVQDELVVDDSDEAEEAFEELEEFTLGDDLSIGDDSGLIDADAPDDGEAPDLPEASDAEGSTLVITPDSEGADEDIEAKAAALTYGGLESMDLEQAIMSAGPCVDGTYNHVIVFDEGVQPTFQDDGLSEGCHCEACGAVLVPQHIIPKYINLWMTLPSKGKYARSSLSVGDEVKVFADFATKYGYTVTSWKSSKPSVADFISSGVFKCYKEGKVTITVKTNKKGVYAKVPLKIRDPYKPAGIKILQGKSKSMCLKQTLQLSTELDPLSARATRTWKSSKPSVATVDQNGKVTAVGEGTTKITVKTQNGKKATIKITVDGIVLNPNIHYRALLIGECFPGTKKALPGDKDVRMMKKMLNSVRGPGGNYWSVTALTNRTREQIQNDIKSAFYGATSSDVSLFFISTHGNDQTTYYSDWFAAGCLSTASYAVSLHTLANWLNQVPGKVIVLIDSCGSGAAIYPHGSKAIGDDSYDPATFNQQVVNAFQEFDQGVLAPYDSSVGAFVLTNKFYVMTASRYLETAWGPKNKYSYFAKWLSSSIKTKGKMPADKNKNSIVTLNEWYNACAKKAKKIPARYRQHVQVYPANSGFELFYRKK